MTTAPLSTCHRVVDHASAEKVIEKEKGRESETEREGARKGGGNTEVCLTRLLIARRQTGVYPGYTQIHTHISLQTTLLLCFFAFGI